MPWGSYGSCTKTCGGGVKWRSRSCKIQGNGQCYGAPSYGFDEVACNEQDCRGEAVLRITNIFKHSLYITYDRYQGNLNEFKGAILLQM